MKEKILNANTFTALNKQVLKDQFLSTQFMNVWCFYMFIYIYVPNIYL